MQNHILALVACLIMTTMSACTQAKTFISEKHRFEVVTVAQGLEHPWSLAFLPDGTLLVTERPGRLRVINKGQLRPQAVTGLPGNIAAVGQGGAPAQQDCRGHGDTGDAPQGKSRQHPQSEAAGRKSVDQ